MIIGLTSVYLGIIFLRASVRCANCYGVYFENWLVIFDDLSGLSGTGDFVEECEY